MKRRFLTLLFIALCTLSCDNGVWDAIHDLQDKYDNLDGRVARLEELCKEMNTNISSLQTLVGVMLNNDYIINMWPIMKDGVEIGYVITFAIHDPITIYHGRNGKDGQDGANGKDGTDGQNGKDGADGQPGKDGVDGKNGTDGKDGEPGKDGKDGTTPSIGVALDPTDNAYYWTLNGEWLLDANGNRIPLTSRDGKDGKDGVDGQNGQDGKDGQNGQDGKDGITPQLKIENNYWYVSTDNGVTWTQLGKAVGEDGKDGQDGKDGEDGDKSIFASVSQDDTNVYFTLVNGTVLTIQKSNDSFEQTVVDNLVLSLSLSKEEVILHNLNDKDTIIATTYPFATSKVTWSVSDATIAEVEDGIIVPKTWGTCIVTARAGDKTTTAHVYVSGNTFSVSTTKKVFFSPGNLIKVSNNAYQFLANGITTSKTGWSRFPSLPNSIKVENSDGDWRLLTSTEWTYLFEQRETANSRYRIIRVGNTTYLIILPDNFIPLDKLSTINDVELWERIGCACLCGTYSNDAYVPDDQRYVSGFYCTSTSGVYFTYSTSSLQPSFGSHDINPIFAVRLIKDVE